MCSVGLGLGVFLGQDNRTRPFSVPQSTHITSKERLQHCAERGRRGAPPSVLVTLADKNVPCQDYYAVLYFKKSCEHKSVPRFTSLYV